MLRAQSRSLLRAGGTGIGRREQPLISFVLTLAALGAVWLAAAIVGMRRLAAVEEANPPRGVFLPVEGGRLHVIVRGPSDAPPERTVVLLHGASSSARDPLLALGNPLVARGFRVISIDRPGHGWSDRPGGRADAAPARQAALVRDALRAHGCAGAIVLGHSLGGAVAAAFALDHPDFVRGLVLLAPVTHPWPGGVSWYYLPASLPRLGWAFSVMVVIPLAGLLVGKAVEGVFAPQRPPPDYMSRTGVMLSLRPSTFRANAEDVRDLKGYVIAQSQRYGGVRQPSVVISGKVDGIVWPSIHSAALDRELPDVSLVLLDGVGHMPHYADPDRVVSEIAGLSDQIAAVTVAAC